MPTPLECIAIKARNGRVTQSLVDDLQQMAADMREADATLDALSEADRLIQQLEFRLQTKEVQTAMQFAAYNRVIRHQAAMEAVPTTRGDKRGEEMMRSILTKDTRDEFVPSELPNVEVLRQVYRGQAHAIWTDGLEALRSKYVGLKQEKALARDVLRALYDEQADVSDLAKDVARQWREVERFLLRAAKRVGFDIAERRDWRVPQSHDTLAVRYAAGRELAPDDPAHRIAWKDAITPKLNREAMISRRTGMKMTDAELDELLDDVFENIATDGLNKVGDLREGSAVRRPSKLADRHSEERVLVFKDADSQIEYDEMFGSGGDYFSDMTGHIDKRATEIAAVQVLGPNPDLTVDLMSQRARAIDGGTDAQGVMNDYLELMGRRENPYSERLAAGARSTRNLLVASQLGGAALSALSDTGFVAMTAHFSGMNPVKTLGAHVSRFIRGAFDKEERLFAIRMGLVAEEAAGSAISAGRVMGEFAGPGVTRMMADTVMRASLLSPWTQAGRHSFGLELLAYFADNAGKRFDDLDPKLQRTLSTRGVSAADWDVARAAEMRERNGVRFMHFDAIAREDPIIAAKIQAAVLEEMEYAIPSSNVRTRVALKGGLVGGEVTRAGTIGGELWRSVGMYKSFPVALMYTHLARAGITPGNLIGRGYDNVNMAYLAPMIFLTTMLGAMSMQAKMVAAGKEPRDPFDPNDPEGTTKFWMAALIQGGGLGLFGDFLFQDHSRFGKSLSASAIGPVFGLVDDVTKLGQNLGGAVFQTAVDGEAPNVGREVANLVRNYTPGGNLWYARVALEREVFDGLQILLDSDHKESFRQKARRAQRDEGTPYFLAPGEHFGINPLRK